MARIDESSSGDQSTLRLSVEEPIPDVSNVMTIHASHFSRYQTSSIPFSGMREPGRLAVRGTETAGFCRQPASSFSGEWLSENQIPAIDIDRE